MALANDWLRFRVGIQHDNFSMSPRGRTRRAPSVGMLGRERGDDNIHIVAAFICINNTTMGEALVGGFVQSSARTKLLHGSNSKGKGNIHRIRLRESAICQIHVLAEHLSKIIDANI